MIRAATDLGPEPVPRSSRARAALPVLAVLLVAAFVVGVWLRGRSLVRAGGDLFLGAGYVIAGHDDLALTSRVLLPVAVALATVAGGPPLAARMRWRPLLPVAAAAAGGWAVVLASTRGWPRLADPMRSRHEYVHDVGRVDGLHDFLTTFLDSVPVGSSDQWVTHVAGHPPGALLVFVALDRLGLDGPEWAAALCIAAGALAVPAVLVTTRVVVGEVAARTAAPFAVLLPGALWIATSADAVFTAVAAAGVLLLALAAARGLATIGLVQALGGGLLLGGALFLSYGLAAIGLLAVAVVVVRWRELGLRGVAGVLGSGAIGVLVVVALFRLGGYWWPDGLHAAGQRVRDGASFASRPFSYFVASNVAAAAIAAGPAVVGGLAGLGWQRRALWLVLPAVGAMAISDVTGLVRGETERIWLPFVVWLIPATATLPVRGRRVWLAAAALLALAVETTFATTW